MVRPRKWRRVCQLPKNNSFAPINFNQTNETIIMSVDEYETIRLIDYEGFTQEQCSKYMRIARTTVQQIYNNARNKIAKSLVDGKALTIYGGDYELCDGSDDFCKCKNCCKRKKHDNLK